MSDAIEFGIGGNNKGFVAVLNDTEKKAKESADKVKREAEKAAKEAEKAAEKAASEAKKAAEDRDKSMAGLVKDLASVRSGGDAVKTVFSQMGAGMRVSATSAAALVVAGTALAGTWAAVARNTKEAYEMQLAMERVGRANVGGVSNRSTSDLEQTLSVIREEREKNLKVINGMAQGLFGSDFLAAGGQVLKDSLARTGASLSSATGGPEIEVQTPEEREKFLREKEKEALDRIAQKQAEIWTIERVRITGAKEEADILEMQARYTERIDAARREGQKSGSTALADQLTAEQQDVQRFMLARNRMAFNERTQFTGDASKAARDAALAVGSTTEEEQRRANQTREDIATEQRYNARDAAASFPNDPDLAAQQFAAEKNLERVIAENAKWERDIARSKGDSVKMAKAETEAREAELRGQRHVADLIKQRAGNEQAIVLAMRAGNTELAKQLQTAGQIERKALARQRVTNGEGQSMRPSEVRAQFGREEAQASEADRAANRIFDKNGNLRRFSATINRQPRRRHIQGAMSGTDLLSARIVDGKVARGAFAKPSDQTPGLPSIAGTPAEEWRSRFPKSRWAENEMNHRKQMADVGASRQERADAEAKAREDRLNSGKATTEDALAALAQILKKWDQGQ